MKKIRYLILGLVFACLGLTSFSSAGTYNFTGSFSSSYTQGLNQSLSQFYIGSPNFKFDYYDLVNVSFSCSLTNVILNETITSGFGTNSKFYLTIFRSGFSGGYGQATTYSAGINSSNDWSSLSDGNITFIGSSSIGSSSNPSYAFKYPSYLILGFYNQSSMYACSYSTPCNISFDYDCSITAPFIMDSSYEDQIDSLSGSLISCQSDLTTCQNTPSGLSCSNTGTVSDLTNKILLYTGEVSLINSSYKNIFNYGENGAGTYCVKLSSSSPQTLTFGFANGGTTTPTNLYQLYNDQYGQVVCLYGNKPYFNAKLNSSSNTVSYEIYKLSDLYSSNVCLENECETCQECEDFSSCQSSLGACLEDNLSLENMNESLSSQLETCLLNGGNGCDPEVDTGCITGAFQVPLLSWSVGLDSFTTPIINNLVLPTNYKGKVVDGVLTISSINNNLSISDQDMVSIKDSVIEVLEFIFGLSLFLVLIYYIKFYMFNSK